MTNPDTAEAKIKELAVQLISRANGNGMRNGTVRDCLNSDWYKESVQQLKGLLVDAQEIELQGVMKYWNDLSMAVPRLQASPPPVKQYIRDRLAALQQTRQEEVRG